MEPLNIELTLEQQLMLRNTTDAANMLTKEELVKWLVDIARLYMLTQNVSKSLIKQITKLEYEQHTSYITNNPGSNAPDAGQ